MSEEKQCKYFLVRNFVTGEYLDFEFDDYYTTFGKLAGATVFDDELYSYLIDEYKKDTHKVYLHLVDDYAKKIIADLEAKLAESQTCACKHIGELTKIATEKDRKIEQLKQQLAEKDKEIERLLIARGLLFSDLHYARMDCEKTNRQIRELDKSCGSIINNLITQIEELKKEKK